MVRFFAFKKLAQASSAKSPFSELVASFALAVVVFVALWQSQNGVTTVGQFMAFIVAMMQMLAPLKNLSNLSIPMQFMFISADSVYDFLDAPPEVNSGAVKLDRARGNIAFKHLDLTYEGMSRKALNDFILEVRAGEKLALVGRSGSGKSSLINLLPRFIEPSAGEILTWMVNDSQTLIYTICAVKSLWSRKTFFCSMIRFTTTSPMAAKMPRLSKSRRHSKRRTCGSLFTKIRKVGICWWVTMVINSQVDSVSDYLLHVRFSRTRRF